jgi:hypothetical protein
VRVEFGTAGADSPYMDRGMVWLFVIVGSTVGGLAPIAWGGSALGGASLLLSLVGGVAGLWAAAKLTG